MANRDTNIASGDSSTEGLPRRVNKEARQAAQEKAARAETHAGFSVGGRPGREGGSWSSAR